MRYDRLSVKFKWQTYNNKFKQRHEYHSLWCLWWREEVSHGQSYLRAWRSGFLLPRYLLASTYSVSTENSWRKSTSNKSHISGIAPDTCHCGPNGALGVAIGTSCYCEGVIVGHEKWECVFAIPPNECSLADISMWYSKTNKYQCSCVCILQVNKHLHFLLIPDHVIEVKTQ